MDDPIDSTRLDTENMTVTVAKPRITQEEPSEDQDEHRRKRVAKWLRDRYDSGGSFDDTPELLLDFERFLAECEAERQRA